LASTLVPTEFLETFSLSPVPFQRTLLSGALFLITNSKTPPLFTFSDNVKPLLAGVVVELLKRQTTLFVPAKSVDIRLDYPVLLSNSIVRWGILNYNNDAKLVK